MNRGTKKGSGKKPATRRRGRPKLLGKSEQFRATQTRIIDAALEEFVKGSYEDVQLADITNKVAINKTGFFYYFPSKTHLLYHVFDRWLGIRLGRMTKLMEIKSPRQRLSALIRDNVNMVVQYRQLVRTWVYAQPRLHAPIVNDCNAKSREIVKLARKTLDDCIEAGIVPPGDTRVLVELCFVPPFSIYAWHNPDSLPPEKVAHDMLAALRLIESS